MFSKASFWLKISLFNLLLVALLGLLLRYKMGFDFAYFDHKFLLHSHSHFAFSGWITHTLMVLMLVFLSHQRTDAKDSFLKKYNGVLIANLICAYVMLISFIIQGYGTVSIIFSTLSIFVSFVFAYLFFQDLRFISNADLAKKWFKAALFFNVISSFGTFYLAFMMATKTLEHNPYLASIYYYLHFQYNGWFFFASIGLLISLLQLKASEHKFYNRFFYLFFTACFPAYFLSTLWLELPLWVHAITILAAIIQVYAWFKFLLLVVQSRNHDISKYPKFLRYILVFVAFSLSLKVLLQLGSTIPSLSEIAYGFRPIVIAYLHLILLAVISLFLLFYVFATHLIPLSKAIKTGLITFAVGVFLNEFILGMEGLSFFSEGFIPYISKMLFGAAVILVLGMGITAFGALKVQK